MTKKYEKGETVYVKGHPGEWTIIQDMGHQVAVVKSVIFKRLKPGSAVPIDGVNAFYITKNDLQDTPFEAQYVIDPDYEAALAEYQKGEDAELP